MQPPPTDPKKRSSPRAGREKGSASNRRPRWLLVVLALALLIATVRQFGYLTKAGRTNARVPTADRSADILFSFLAYNISKKPKSHASSPSGSGTAERPKKSNTTTSPNYHVIFSTSCDPQQHWESYLLFYSAMKVGQPGNVTRIVSGCKPDEAQKLREFHAKVVRRMSDRFHVHFTPDFSKVRLESGKHPFKYGVLHWMEQALGITPKTATSPAKIPEEYVNDIVMVPDPDMVLLRPLRHDFTDEEVLWVTDPPASKVVRHGYPISQQDGYLGMDWMDLDWSYITNRTDGQYLKHPPRQEGAKRWIAGPPYMATVKDMYEIAVLWAEYSPRVLDLYTGIFAEMFGYIIASVQLKLPHTFVKSVVVSVTDANRREGWMYVDEIPDDQVCEVNDVPMPPSARMPIGLHYCQRYWLGDFFFSKYRVKKNILDCDQALYLLPPKDILRRYNYTVGPKRADGEKWDKWREVRQYVEPQLAKREAFILCRMMNYLNEALRYLKDRTCPNKGNQNETLSVYLDPTD